MKNLLSRFVLFTVFLSLWSINIWGQSFSVSASGVKIIGCVPHSLTGFPYPLLSGFKLDFADKDHHLNNISIRSDQDIHKVCVEYNDKLLDDKYSFLVDYFNETRSGVIYRFIEGSCSGGACTISLEQPPTGDYTFVLKGFTFQFTTRPWFWTAYQYTDHHIGSIGINPSTSQTLLSVRYSDKNEDDKYDWKVWYAWVPNNLIRQKGQAKATNAKGQSKKEIPSGITVISGFILTFGQLSNPTGEDHHIDEIGVLANHAFQPGEMASNITVFFNDKNDDDTFDWSVDYVILREPETNSFLTVVNSTDEYFIKAFKEIDVPALDSLLSDDFIFTTSMGDFIRKRDFMNRIENRALIYGSYNADYPNTCVREKTANVNGYVTVQQKIKGKVLSEIFRNMHIYERRGKKWQLVAIRLTLE